MKLKDRSIDKYKTIFFVEGYKQKEWIDDLETYSLKCNGYYIVAYIT